MTNNRNALYKQELMVKIEERLNEMYKSPPSALYERLEKELEYIERNSQLNTLRKVIEIRDIAAKNKLPLLLNGTASGSFILYLIGVSNYNPLPAHYVCKNCGQFEWSKESRFGIDLSQKFCEDCGAELHRDGYSVSIHSIWHYGEGTLRFDFFTVPILIDLCKPILNEVSSDITIAPSDEMEEIKWLSEATFHILRHSEFNGGKAIEFINDKLHKKLPFITSGFIETYINKRGPITVEQLTKLYAGENSKYCEGYSAKEYLLEQNKDPNEYLYDREDLYDLLITKGIDEDKAASVASAVRKGKGRESLVQLPVQLPNWVYDVADQVKYLFPRAHSISRIIVVLQAAEYRSKYSYEFDKEVLP